jgi:hypothetical protein
MRVCHDSSNVVAKEGLVVTPYFTWKSHVLMVLRDTSTGICWPSATAGHLASVSMKVLS